MGKYGIFYLALEASDKMEIQPEFLVQSISWQTCPLFTYGAILPPPQSCFFLTTHIHPSYSAASEPDSYLPVPVI